MSLKTAETRIRPGIAPFPIQHLGNRVYSAAFSDLETYVASWSQDIWPSIDPEKIVLWMKRIGMQVYEESVTLNEGTITWRWLGKFCCISYDVACQRGLPETYQEVGQQVHQLLSATWDALHDPVEPQHWDQLYEKHPDRLGSLITTLHHVAEDLATELPISRKQAVLMVMELLFVRIECYE